MLSCHFDSRNTGLSLEQELKQVDISESCMQRLSSKSDKSGSAEGSSGSGAQEPKSWRAAKSEARNASSNWQSDKKSWREGDKDPNHQPAQPEKRERKKLVKNSCI